MIQTLTVISSLVIRMSCAVISVGIAVVVCNLVYYVFKPDHRGTEER